MAKRTGPTNSRMKSLIINLKKKSIDEKVKVWKRVAEELEKPTRKRRIVNLSRINKHGKENETVLVPGKVLSDGELSRKLAIAAFSFSEHAKNKINSASCNALSIEELMSKNPKGKNVRIFGIK